MDFYTDVTTKLQKYLKDDQDLYNHLLRTATSSKNISDYLMLSEPEKKMAFLIGLVYDIGKYINKDSITLLFEDKVIRKIMVEETYDDVIRDVIYFCNTNRIPEYYPDTIKAQINILRDSSRLEQLYLDTIKLDIVDSNPKVSAGFIKDFSMHKECNANEIKASFDRVILDLSYIFTFYSKYSLYTVEKEKYIAKIISNLHLSDNTSVELFKQLELILDKFIRDKIGEAYHGW